MTHKYKVELQRLFRGHPLSLGKPEYIEIGQRSHDRTLICKAKEAFGFGGIKTNKIDQGDTILLKFRENKTHQLSIKFCH